MNYGLVTNILSVLSNHMLGRVLRLFWVIFAVDTTLNRNQFPVYTGQITCGETFVEPDELVWIISFLTYHMQ
jgi:nitrogen fixation protein FixH